MPKSRACRNPGPPPFPRRRINPKLYDTVRACGRPVWQLAIDAGFRHHAKFSALINAAEIPATPTNIERLYRICDVVGFDRTQLFLDKA